MIRRQSVPLSVCVVVSGLLATACGGGVDRDGTRDLFLEELQDAGFDADADCVDDVLDRYSDDELEQADDDPSGALATQIGGELVACVDVGG